jgi:hypothetical protein
MRRDRQKRLMAMYSGAKKGLLPRSITSPYLLSSILMCGLCGGTLIIITGYNFYGHYPKYGCSQHFNILHPLPYIIADDLQLRMRNNPPLALWPWAPYPFVRARRFHKPRAVPNHLANI